MAKRGRRANGEGTVFLRESRQRYEAELRTGSVRKVFTGKTRKAALDKLRAAQTALEHGLEAPDNRTSIAAFTDWWMREVLPGEGLAPATVRNYEDVLNNYVLPAVGKRTLAGPNALTPHDVEAMTAALGRMEEFRLHAASTPQTGVTDAEVDELLFQIAAYCGAPAGIAARRSLLAVRAERDTTP